LLPPLVVAWEQYNAATHQMTFNDGEVLGMIYMDPLHDLIDAQERHWVASVARATGNKEMASNEASSAARADEMLKKLEEVNAKYRHDHRFELSVPDANDKVAARLKDVRSDWQKAKDIAGKGTAADIHAAHATALATTSDFIVNYISNYSNLILDPDLDSYWLMDIAIAKAPTIGIDLASATSLALQGLQGDKTDWIYSVTGFLTDANGIVGYMETINLATSIATSKDYGNNPKVPLLKGPYNELKAATTALTTVIKDTHIRAVLAGAQAPVEGGAPPAPAKIDMAPLLAASTTLFDKLDRLYDDNNVPLKELAQRRVDKYNADRFAGVLFTILAVLLHIWVFAAFYFNMKDSIGNLAVSTARMIAGTNERFVTKSKDEISDIVEDFNQINAALVEARALQARIADENAQTQANIVDLLQVVSDASDGNLTVRAHTSAGSLGNVADAFNLLMESLESLVGDVSKQVVESEKAVQSIATVAKKMAQGATNQAKEVVAARQLVDAVAHQITQVSANAEGASQATKRTAETAEQGEKAVENVIHGMDALRANVQSGAKKMKNLGDRSMEITSIVGTISRISEQTNMLALNAAIEAARAGEHGRGFSVVADEVRKLAERATNATKDIEKLVKAITAETNETIKAIEQQTQVVEEESRSVAAAGESLRKIRTASDQSAGLVVGITTVAKQQVDQAQRVARTMESVSAIATDTQHGADSTVATINELVRLSTDLRKSIGQFRVSGR
jgi:methyl-accepting chemotaxis protein